MSNQINQSKINVFFDRMTEGYGLNQAGRVHQALLRGEITPEVRANIRKSLAECVKKPSIH